MESNIAITRRLRRQGVWDESCVFRVQMRQQFRTEGLSRTEAWESRCRPALSAESRQELRLGMMGLASELKGAARAFAGPLPLGGRSIHG